MPYLGIFWLQFEKHCCHIWNQHPQISPIANLAKKKSLNLGSKICNLGIFGLESEKNILSYLKSAPSNLSKCKILWKTKMPKFGTKNALFGYFYARVLENYCHIWNQHFRYCLIPTFCEETKMLKFGTKNALFEYFWPKLRYLGIFGI